MGLLSLCGDVAWLCCFKLSVSADLSTVCKLSNSFCKDGGPESSELLPTLQIVSVSNMVEFSKEAKPYETGPEDLWNSKNIRKTIKFKELNNKKNIPCYRI